MPFSSLMKLSRRVNVLLPERFFGKVARPNRDRKARSQRLVAMESLENRLMLTVAEEQDGQATEDCPFLDPGHYHGDGHDHQHGDSDCLCCCNQHGHAHPDALYAPGTDPSVLDGHFEHFQNTTGWTNTATDGGGLGLGDPATVTWSIVPDGTPIPALGGIPGESADASDLVSFFRGIYGETDNPADLDYTDEIWFGHVKSSFDRWSEISGINYVYEPNDDGVAFSAFSNNAPGVLGVRGDARVGGHFIDGTSNVLAYNFFPNNGEMVVDTGDGFYSNTSSNSLRLRNVITHEIGHGLGLRHVESNNGGFLMEPFINLGFDGPQFDDVLGVQRIYGDINEFGAGNDTSGNATSLGNLGLNQTVTIGADANDAVVAITDTDFVSIDDNSDIDLYAITITQVSALNITLAPQGPTYNEGAQGGSQSTFVASALSDLTLQLIGPDGSTVLATANANGLGGSETITGFGISTPGTYFVRITGAQDAAQMYRLDATAVEATLQVDADNVSVQEGNSGTTDVTFTLTRTNTSGTGSVDFEVLAANGITAADFSGGTLPTGTVNFIDGQGTAQITVQVVGDAIVEGDEQLTVQISNPVNLVITGNSASTVITNDDTANLTLQATAVSQAEGTSVGSTAFTFTVTLDNAVQGGFNLSFTTNDVTTTVNSDYIDNDGTLTFTGNANEMRTITVLVTADSVVEADEVFSVALGSLSGLVNVDANDISFLNTPLLATIDNDDTANLTVSSVNSSQSEGTGGTTTSFTLNVTLSQAVQGGFTVPYLTNDGTATVAGGDYVDNDGTLTFTGSANQTRTVTVLVNHDAVVEADEVFQFALGSIANLSTGVDANDIQLQNNPLTATIINDDAGGITLTAVTPSLNEGDGTGTTSFTFDVTLNIAVEGGFTIDFNTSDLSATTADNDYIANSGTLTFTGNLNETKTVTVLVNRDDTVEADETFQLLLSNIANLGAGLDQNDLMVSNNPATAQILNDDTATLTLTPVVSSLAENSGSSFSFQVSLDNDVAGGFTLDYRTDDDTANSGSDYTDNDGSFAFTGVGGQTETITVQFANDITVEADEVFNVVLAAIRDLGLGIDANDILFSGSPQAATIINDDSATLTFTPVASTQSEGDGNGTTAFTYNVTLDNPVEGGFNLTYTIVDDTATLADGDFQNVTAPLMFAGTAGETQTLTVLVNADSKVEADETFQVQLGVLTPNVTGVEAADIVVPTALQNGVIENDDTSTISLALVNANRTEGSGGNTTSFTFAASLSAPIQGTFQLDYLTNDGTATVADEDYVDNDGSILVDGEENQSLITVEVNHDTKVELSELFTVVLQSIRDLTPGLDPADVMLGVGDAIQKSGTIQNDDTATLSIQDVSQVEGTGQNTVMQFAVTLSNAVDASLFVNFGTAGNTATAGQDYQSSQGTLGFLGNEGEVQLINVTLSGDFTSENDENFFVRLLGTNFQGRSVTVSRSEATGTIENDDQAVITSTGFGIAPVVRVTHSPTGVELFNLQAYDPNFIGGVRIATGDLTGDGTPDIITGPGPGGGPHIRVFNGATGAEVGSGFFAYSSNFLGGVWIAADDFNNDGIADIVVGPDAGGGPHVRVFDGATFAEIFGFFAYSPVFFGGVRVAAGDISGDGVADVVTAPGPGGGPHVRVLNGVTRQEIPRTIGNFFPYNQSFTGGVFVATGFIDGDDWIDLITAPGAGGGPHVRVFSGANSQPLPGQIGSFFAFDDAFRGGVRVAAGDVSGDGQDDIIVAAGIGGGPHVRAFNPDNANNTLTESFSFFAAVGNYTGGVFLAGGTAEGDSQTPALNLAAGTAPGTGQEVTQQEVAGLFEASLIRLQSQGASEDIIDRLSQLTIEVGDLPGSQLGNAIPDGIVIDRNAAGVGWFVDATPLLDEEFDPITLTAITPNAEGVIDLLSVILHELAHHLGGDHLDQGEFPNHLLADTLTPGTRRSLDSKELDLLFADPDFLHSVS